MDDSLTTDMTGGLYRRIYSGFLTGRRINTVSLEAEAWFWRLHAIADDFGNLHGDRMLLKSLAAPRREALSAVDAENLTGELLHHKLVVAYDVDGERYLHIDGFEKRQPAGKNGRRIQKFPVYPGESGGIQGHPLPSSPPIPIPIPIPIPKTILAAAPRPKKARTEVQVERDALWDAIVAEWKMPVSTSTQLGRVGKMVSEFKGAGAKPEEIAARRKAIVERWGDGAGTPESVAKHWTELEPKAGELPWHLRPEIIELTKGMHQ